MDKRTGEGDRQVYWSISDQPRFGSDQPLYNHEQGEQDHPSLAMGENGLVWAVWEDERSGHTRVYLRSSADADRVWQVNDEGAEASYPSVACQGSTIAVTYHERTLLKSKVVVQVFRDSADLQSALREP